MRARGLAGCRARRTKVRLSRVLRCILALGPSACAVEDSHVAQLAQNSLVGLSEAELVSCLGVPNRRERFGQMSVLSYDGSSTSSGGLSLTLPVVGGLSFTGGGNCHLAVRVDSGRVSSIRYTGEVDAPFAPRAYCAPLVRSCVTQPPSPAPVQAPAPQAPLGSQAEPPPAYPEGQQGVVTAAAAARSIGCQQDGAADGSIEGQSHSEGTIK